MNDTTLDRGFFLLHPAVSEILEILVLPGRSFSANDAKADFHDCKAL
jgi:hypothetical protein